MQIKAITSDFATFLFQYLANFKQWNVPDEKKLVNSIEHALMALYQAEHHLPPDEPEDSTFKIEFRTQIERLCSKLLQIGGQEELNNSTRSAPLILLLLLFHCILQ